MDKTPEQIAEENRLAAEEAQRKADEEKAKQDQAAAASKTDPNKLTEDQLVALEKQTGFTRQQLTTMGVMSQQSLTANPQIAEILEDRAMSKGRQALLSAGVKAEDAASLDKKVKEQLAKLTPQDRANSLLIENIYWIERGKLMGTPPASSTSTRVMKSGTDSGSSVDDAAQTKDLSSLSEMERYVAERSGIITLEEWNKYKSKSIDTSYEKNFKPQFGGR